MATPSRPLLALRQTPERHTRQKTRSPQHAHHSPHHGRHHNHNHHHHGHLLTKERDASSSVTTRRSALATPQPPPSLPSLPSLHTLARSSSSSSRKRPASALSTDDASADASARPPTKVTVTQPHGQLLRITNGVPATLGLHQDDLPSGPSTPRVTQATPVASLPVPSTASQSQDKRSLRSHDGGSRLKSDLATYFANYDDIIAGLPETSDLVDLETPIRIVDEPLKPAPKRLRTSSAEPSRKPPPASPNRSRKKAPTPSRQASQNAPQSSTAFQVLDYAPVARHLRHDHDADPLADEVYFTQHRRAERKEKQLRNIEKERAMHEKVQLERLLDGLLGPDWLKVMGITGVTDGERKDWEPKRDYFVKEVETLVDKFRIWKEEEKRLRTEKEAALAARDEDEAESPTSDDTNANSIEDVQRSEPQQHHQKEKEHKTPQPRRPPRPHGYVLPPPPPEPLAPFTSFYSKPHLRAAALGKHRHGRNATAFGQPIPDFREHYFEIPPEFITPDALRDHARKRRRQKRESGVKKK